MFYNLPDIPYGKGGFDGSGGGGTLFPNPESREEEKNPPPQFADPPLHEPRFQIRKAEKGKHN